MLLKEVDKFVETTQVNMRNYSIKAHMMLQKKNMAIKEEVIEQYEENYVEEKLTEEDIKRRAAMKKYFLEKLDRLAKA
jgi:hypothetical protein